MKEELRWCMQVDLGVCTFLSSVFSALSHTAPGETETVGSSEMLVASPATMRPHTRAPRQGSILWKREPVRGRMPGRVRRPAV